MIETVRNAYAPSDFWSKVAKRVCRRPTFLRKRLDWCRTIRDFLSEYSYIQDTRGYILEPSLEAVEDFLGRLTCRLHLTRELSEAERGAMLEALRSDSPVPELESGLAKALILKACLECGRLRPMPPKSLSVKDLVENIRTVDELLEYGIAAPLPKRAALDPRRMPPEEFSRVLARARSTPEYHLTVASYTADFKYHQAVKEISRAFTSLDSAYQAIMKKSGRSNFEEEFALKYRDMSEMIL